jgi:hypothetical protein
MSGAMPTFQPVATLADLETLDATEISAGYREFERGDPEPGPNRGRAYWHGWRNAAMDAGQIERDAAAWQLVHEVAPRGVFNRDLLGRMEEAMKDVHP